MTVGEQLRKAREARGYTLAEVTQRTKIQPWVLQAFEADRPPEQLSPIYVRGFLSTYARFLHLAPEPLLAQVQWQGQSSPAAEETPAAAAQTVVPAAKATAAVKTAKTTRIQKAPEAAPETVRQPIRIKLPAFRLPTIRLSLPWPLIRRAGLAATAAVAIVAIVRANPLQHAHLPKLELAKKPAASTKMAKVNKQMPAAERRTAKPAVATAASAAVAPAAKLASIAPVAEDLVRQPAAPPQIPVVPVKPLELSVSAAKTTWIRVRADGKLLTQQRLQRGAREQWTAKKSFEVVVAKPSQVEIVLNGQSISPLAIAHKGRLSITHQGILPLPEDAS